MRRFFPFAVCVLLLITSGVVGCKSEGLKRPYGFMKLGTLNELANGESYRPDLRLVVRHDDNGYSVMSTMCTHDLTPLTRAEEDGQIVWKSSYTTSTYSYDGRVVNGPSKIDLPHYNIKVDSSVYGGPRDTLYAEIGLERELSWRFKIP